MWQESQSFVLQRRSLILNPASLFQPIREHYNLAALHSYAAYKATATSLCYFSDYGSTVIFRPLARRRVIVL